MVTSKCSFGKWVVPIGFRPMIRLRCLSQWTFLNISISCTGASYQDHLRENRRAINFDCNVLLCVRKKMGWDGSTNEASTNQASMSGTR